MIGYFSKQKTRHVTLFKYTCGLYIYIGIARSTLCAIVHVKPEKLASQGNK